MELSEIWIVQNYSLFASLTLDDEIHLTVLPLSWVAEERSVSVGEYLMFILKVHQKVLEEPHNENIRSEMKGWVLIWVSFKWRAFAALLVNAAKPGTSLQRGVHQWLVNGLSAPTPLLSHWRVSFEQRSYMCV